MRPQGDSHSYHRQEAARLRLLASHATTPQIKTLLCLRAIQHEIAETASHASSSSELSFRTLVQDRWLVRLGR